MLKILLRKQMGEIFRSYYYNAKKNKARSKAATAAYIVLFVLLMVLVLGGMFTLLSLFLCGAMLAAKMQWLYLAACLTPTPGFIWQRITTNCFRYLFR